MATTKVSALAAKTSLAGSEELLINDSGTSKKVTATNLLAGVSVADGSISTAKLAADAVTGAKIADDAIDSEHYTDGSIDTAHIADDAVTAAKLANSINTDIATGVTANTTANAALPKSGGAMTGDLILGDNVKLEVGSASGGDLQIYHDGSNSYIRDAGTGDLTIQAGNDLRLQDPATKAYLTCNQDDSVQIYYDNNVRFQTTNAGVSVTGSITPTGSITHASDLNFDAASDIVLDADGGKIKFRDAGTDIAYLENSNSGDLLIKSITDDKDIKIQGKDGGSFITAVQFDMSDNGKALFNNDVKIPDNAQFQAGASADLKMYHDGSDSIISDDGTGTLLLMSNGNGIYIQKTTTETMAQFVVDGAVKLYYDNSKKFETTATGISINGTAIATTDTDTSNTGSVTLDFGAYQNFVLTLTGNVTLANPSTEQVGQSGFITFIQDGTGSRTVSLGTDYETAGGAGLTLTSTASATDIVPYVVVASGRILLGTPQLAFA